MLALEFPDALPTLTVSSCRRDWWKASRATRTGARPHLTCSSLSSLPSQSPQTYSVANAALLQTYTKYEKQGPCSQVAGIPAAALLFLLHLPSSIMHTFGAAPQPFTIAVSDEEVADLNARLDAARWPLVDVVQEEEGVEQLGAFGMGYGESRSFQTLLERGARRRMGESWWWTASAGAAKS